MTNAKHPLRPIDVPAASGGRPAAAGAVGGVERRLDQEPAVAGQDLGGEQALRRGAVRKARRAGSGHPALHLVLAGAGGEGVRAGAAARGAAGVHPGVVEAVLEELRPHHPDAAAGVAAGVAAAGAGAVPEVAPGGAVHHRDLLDVADGAEHGAGRAIDPAGLPERRQGAAAVAQQDALQGAAAGRAAVHVHRLPPEPRDRVAGDRGGRDADRHARRRRLPVAGVQQPDLRAHHPVHPHDRHRGLRARPADEHGRAEDCERRPDGIPGAERRRQGLRPQGRPQRGAARASTSPSSAASSWPSSAIRAPARRRWSADRGAVGAGQRHASRWTASRSRGRAPIAASCSRTTRCCRG